MTRLLALTLAVSASAQGAPAGTSLTTNLWKGLRGDYYALIWLGLMQVGFIMAAWFLSRAIVPRRELNSFGQYERRSGGGFGRAFLLYFLYAALVAVVVMGMRLASPDFKLSVLTALTAPATLGAKRLAILLGIAVGAIVVGVALPMAVFRIRLWRSLFLLLLIAVLLAGVGWGLDVALGKPVERRAEAVRKRAAEYGGKGGLLTTLKEKTQQEVTFEASEQVAADQARPLAERKEAVRKLYTQLETIRAQLRDGDVAGRQEYDRKKERYDEALKKIRAEITAGEGN